VEAAKPRLSHYSIVFKKTAGQVHSLKPELHVTPCGQNAEFLDVGVGAGGVDIRAVMWHGVSWHKVQGHWRFSFSVVRCSGAPDVCCMFGLPLNPSS
jgi:hypothetical protein